MVITSLHDAAHKRVGLCAARGLFSGRTPKPQMKLSESIRVREDFTARLKPIKLARLPQKDRSVVVCL